MYMGYYNGITDNQAIVFTVVYLYIVNKMKNEKVPLIYYGIISPVLIIDEDFLIVQRDHSTLLQNRHLTLVLTFSSVNHTNLACVNVFTLLGLMSSPCLC